MLIRILEPTLEVCEVRKMSEYSSNNARVGAVEVTEKGKQFFPEERQGTKKLP